MKNKLIVAIIFLLTVMLHCENKNERKNKMNFVSGIKTISNIDLNKLKNKKIYFGHQSVGYNILDGINDIVKENKLEGFRIVETNNIEDFNKPIFGHSKNGKNTDPISKVDTFVNSINNGLGKKLNIAFFKLCYVDIYSNSDVDSIFKYYQKNMKELKNKFPKVKFIHFTVPITTHKTLGLKDKIKDFLKSIIGKETYQDTIKKENIKRKYYNELIRSSYKKNEIFDLAEIESINPNGNKELLIFNGKQYESLVPDYTNDGGHLNELGRSTVANAFLNYLTKMD